MKLEMKRVRTFLFVTIGSTIISTAVLHATYTEIFSVLAIFSIFILFFSAFFIGVLCHEFKDALIAMFISLTLSIVILVVLRSLPAFLGIITSGAVFFVISQFALSLPLIFPLIMVYVLGVLAGLIFSTFAFDPYTKDL
ncbi:MAG: hypothetical protein Q6364_01135 [Candidatus Hermodarchaeota archaeon]|nr:hypothetical protein [Candidatus Hermodarchaeota archaeon]